MPLSIDNQTRSDWPILWRAMGVAADPRCLVLAALAGLLVRFGGLWLASMFGEPESISGSWLNILSEPPNWLTWQDGLARLAAPILTTLGPMIRLFSPNATAAERLHAAASGVWSILVWSVFGGAILRIAAVRIARSERLGIVSALRFSIQRLRPMLAAPLAPICVAWLIALMGAMVGLLTRLPGSFGSSAAMLLAFVPLIVGLLDAVILIGLIGAWPMMVATILIEGEDFFDALSRSYSYVNQRTFRYAGYGLVTGIIGLVGLLVVSIYVRVILGLSDWSVSLTAPRDVGFRFLDPSTIEKNGLSSVGWFWLETTRALAAAWASSFFWSSIAILYLLLRRDVDGAEIHDIYNPTEASHPFLPDEPAPTPASDSDSPDAPESSKQS